MLCMGKSKTLNFLESIEICQLKVGTYSWLSTWINMRSSGQVRWLTALSKVSQIFFFFFFFIFFHKNTKGISNSKWSLKNVSLSVPSTHTLVQGHSDLFYFILLSFFIFYFIYLFLFYFINIFFFAFTFFSQKYKGNFKLQIISEECISICTIYTHTLVTVGGGTCKS